MYTLVELANYSYDIVLAANVSALDDTDTCVVKQNGKKQKCRSIMSSSKLI